MLYKSFVEPYALGIFVEECLNRGDVRDFHHSAAIQR